MSTLRTVIEREIAAGPVTDGQLAARLGHSRASVRNVLTMTPHAIDAEGRLYPPDSDAGRAAGAFEHRPVSRPPSDSERAEAKAIEEVAARVVATVCASDSPAVASP